MHNIGDNIVYGAVGVMTVVDIKEETILDTSKTYYLLREYGSPAPSLTYVPCDNEQLVSMMRGLLSRDEALAAIEKCKSMPDIEWSTDNRSRTDMFKRIMESGDRALILSLIRSVHNAGMRRAENGKKNFLIDENAGKRAEKLIVSEFAISLGMDELSVRELINEKIKGIEKSIE